MMPVTPKPKFIVPLADPPYFVWLLRPSERPSQLPETNRMSRLLVGVTITWCDAKEIVR
jgi:hypothetical protein